ncbi:hypothetical protein GCM10009609_30600 [Pseudonocardia aurantiaca]
MPLLSAALGSFAASDDLGLLWLAAMATMELCDLEAWLQLTERGVRFARATGTLSILPAALSYRAGALTFAGRFAEAWDALDEAAVAGQATGLATYMVTGAVMAAYRGREAETLQQVAAMERDAEQRGMGRCSVWPDTPEPCSTTASATTRSRWRRHDVRSNTRI